MANNGEAPANLDGFPVFGTVRHVVPFERYTTRPGHHPLTPDEQTHLLETLRLIELQEALSGDKTHPLVFAAAQMEGCG
jgi:hypothetical protein